MLSLRHNTPDSDFDSDIVVARRVLFHRSYNLAVGYLWRVLSSSDTVVGEVLLVLLFR